MNRIESSLQSITCKIAGIKAESEGLKWYSVATLGLSAKIDSLVNRTHYEGDLLPQNGPALIAVNHRSGWDIPRGIAIAQRSHRLIRSFAKNTLMNPRLQEHEEVRARTGHKIDLLNIGHYETAPWWRRKVADGIASVIKGAETIATARGGTIQDHRKSFKEAGKKLSKGLLVGILLQEERQIKQKGTLGGLKQGAEIVALQNPNVPIYAVAMCHRRVSIKRLGTYYELLNNPVHNISKLAEMNLTVLIADAIADMSDPEIKDDWYKVQRPKLLKPDK